MLVHVFHGTLASFKYVFKNGKEAAFKGGKFITDSESEAAELKAEITLGHPHISQKEGEEKIEAEMLDPIFALRAKMFEEFLSMTEEQRAALAKPRDMGTSTQPSLKPASSLDIAAATLGGPSAALLDLHALTQLSQQNQ